VFDARDLGAVVFSIGAIRIEKVIFRWACQRRPPRGGLSEIRSGIVIRRLR
jgi:hypothetical protein